MRKSIYDLDYKSKLGLMDTQIAIKYVKDAFQTMLVKNLNLTRVTAPLFVLSSTGLNDNLNGVETPVSFYKEEIGGNVEIIHSLAKWKRNALAKYDFKENTGLYTDMNAIRKDEDVDFIHSLYVDQWDWEVVINKNDRNFNTLKNIVCKIYDAIYELEQMVNKKYPSLKCNLPSEIAFISTSELESMYPNLSRKEREDEITRVHKAVFLYQIGYNLKDGKPHDGRAADYDDYHLNGDILVYYPLYDMALELSSMGIRVDENSLVEQLKFKHEEYKLDNDYCKAIITKKLPYTIGGGIGQSRLCMFMLQKAHIGEVQVSLWRKDELEKLKQKNIELL